MSHTFRTWLFWAVLVVLALGFQGSRALTEPDEGRYTNIALQMLDSGDWWVPRLHAEEPHFAKPPLTYWLIAASVGAFGRNEWAVRLPHALAFLLTALLVADIARSLACPSPRLAALVWATSLGALAGASVVSTDAILMTFETAAMAAALRSGLLGAGPPRRVFTILMWVAFGLAFLTKGPPGLLPLAALSLVTPLRRLVDPVGIPCFLVLGLGWFASMVAGDGALVSYFLRYELVDRVVTGIHGRNAHWWGPLSVYVPTLALGVLPWAVPVAWTLRTHVGWPGPTRRLLWLWLAIPLGVFALSRSRLPFYVLPLFVPMALLMTPQITAVAEKHPRRLAAFAGMWIALCLGLKAGAAHVGRGTDTRALAANAAAIGAGMSSPMDEIAFVETKPVYGLRLYTSLPIERIRLDGDVDVPEAEEHTPRVCEEAREPENPLWLVPSGRTKAFEGEVRACGLTPRLLPGELTGLLPYEVLRRPV